MKPNRFNDLINDEKAVRVPYSGSLIFESERKKLNVVFIFSHDSRFTPPFESSNRISINIHEPSVQSDVIPPIKMGNEIVILVNAATPDHALSYLLTINEEKQIAKVKLLDRPTLGESLIGNTETNGIHASLV